MKAPKNIIPVILCGGSGTRLWPASRADHPKQFLPLMNDYSLLQNTAKRALKLSGAPASSLVTVTLANFEKNVLGQLSDVDTDASRHLLCEPMARNTAAALAYAAYYIAETFGSDVLMWVFPSDHHIENEQALANALSHGSQPAQDGYLVTFGIVPDRPETDYGYIHVGAKTENPSVFAVHEFMEKPSLESALAYLETDEHLWNSGMFLLSAGAVLAQYESYAPDTLNKVRHAMQQGTPHQPDTEIYQSIKSQPFDKAIMERSGKVRVVPMDAGWSDIGTWESLWSIRPKDKNNNVVDGRAACYNAQGNLVMAQDRLVAIAGLDNIVVIETDDAILIGDKRDTASLKTLVSSLKKAGAPEATRKAVYQTEQPWTMVKSLGSENAIKAQEMTLAPDETINRLPQENALSLFTVLEGQLSVAYGDQTYTLSTMESITVPSGSAYSLSNTSNSPVTFIELHKPQKEGIFFAPPVTLPLHHSRKIA